MMEPHREAIILDTDLAMGVPGEDIDDGFALALACADPALDLRLVTTVDGNTDVDNATLLSKQLLNRLGRRIPVVRGADRPLLGRRRKFWGVLSDVGNARHDEATPAAMRIVETIRKGRDGEYTLVAIGPLTNIALAIMLDPTIVERVRRLVVMGGVFFTTKRDDAKVPGEFNFWADPEAAQLVMHSGIDMRLVGLDVTEQVTMTLPESAELYASGGEFGSFAGRCALGWIDRIREWSDGEREEFFLHDPLAVAAIAHPEFFSWTDCHVDMALSGVARGMSIATARGLDECAPLRGHCQASDGVDAARFKMYLFDLLRGM